ncbi:MAG: glycosyltransferase family 2 protein [Alphaproteobacteria bacterium]|nr:glycosyltransferase family 2 protein [Alphaproteobacteria bacterium]
MPDHNNPDISVVVTQDYAVGEPIAWGQLRSNFQALSAQDFGGTVETIYVETSQIADQIPPDFKETVPGLRIVCSDAPSAYGLIRDGVESARSDVVAVIDGDCVPDRNWLSRIVMIMGNNPKCAVLTGMTTYGPRSQIVRILALLSRSFLHRTELGETEYLTNNNAAYRRTAFLSNPLIDNVGPFSAGMQARALRRNGHLILYDPGLHVVHDHIGWRFERDSRRHAGYVAIKSREADATMPNQWLRRVRYASIPIIVGKGILTSWGQCYRFRKSFGVAWYAMLLAFVAAIGVHLLEVPGMIDGLRGRPVPQTAFR